MGKTNRNGWYGECLDFLISYGLIFGVVIAILLGAGCHLVDVEDHVDEALDVCKAAVDEGVAECLDGAAEASAEAEHQCRISIRQEIDVFEEWMRLEIMSLMFRLGCEPEIEGDIYGVWDCSELCE